MRTRKLRNVSYLLTGVFVLALANSSSPAQTSLPEGCATSKELTSDADAALYLEDWGRATRLYHVQLEKSSESLPARAGLVRVMLGQERIDDALSEAVAITSQHGDSVVAQTVLAETYLRRGELVAATPVLSKALAEDKCYARAHLQEARLQNLWGFHASAARQLEQAHALDPNDEQITLAWMFSLPPAERFSKLKDFVSQAKLLNESDREDLRSDLLEGEARMSSSCTVSAPEGGTSSPFIVNPDLSSDAGAPTIDVVLNGKSHRMSLRTSSGAFYIDTRTAKSMGLVPIIKFSYAQNYGGGRVHYFLANLSSFRIGHVEYKNCLVTVIDEPPNTDVGLEASQMNPAGAAGLIGTGFFADFLVGIDTPKRLFTLSALAPPMPETDSRGLPTWSNISNSKANPVQSINGGAWGQYNRTAASTMKDWTPLVRYRDTIWIPAHSDAGPPRLFLLELASPWPRISTTAAKKAVRIETITTGKAAPFKGYFLEYAGRLVSINSWSSVRIDEFSKRMRLETSGTIGGESLRKFNMTIDYRDNLIRFMP